MEISKNGLDLIQNFEGCRLDSYLDGAGVWTIGWGHTETACADLQWTQDEADAALGTDVAQIACEPVNRLVSVNLTQNQFDALCSFTYNLGQGNLASSTLLRKLNAGDYAGAQAEFCKWNLVAGQPSSGLARRREIEAELFGRED